MFHCSSKNPSSLSENLLYISKYSKDKCLTKGPEALCYKIIGNVGKTAGQCIVREARSLGLEDLHILQEATMWVHWKNPFLFAISLQCPDKKLMLAGTEKIFKAPRFIFTEKSFKRVNLLLSGNKSRTSHSASICTFLHTFQLLYNGLTSNKRDPRKLPSSLCHVKTTATGDILGTGCWSLLLTDFDTHQ